MNSFEQAAKRPRLPDKTRLFVQHAFESGSVEALDEIQKKVLAKYVFNDQLAFDTLRTDIGTSLSKARRLYIHALTTIWEISSPEVQEKFPKEEVVVGKSKGREISPERKEKLSKAYTGKNIGRKHTEETKAKIGRANRGKRLSEEVKAGLRAAHRKRWERWRRERGNQQKEEQVIFTNSNNK